MKRQIKGRAYNTKTSTLVARSPEWRQVDAETNIPVIASIYATRTGLYFKFWASDTKHADFPNGTAPDEGIEPMSRAAVLRALKADDCKILNDKVAAGIRRRNRPNPQVTFSMRLPRSLVENIDTDAKDAGLSRNAWLTRCVEQGLRAKHVIAHLREAHFILADIGQALGNGPLSKLGATDDTGTRLNLEVITLALDVAFFAILQAQLDIELEEIDETEVYDPAWLVAHIQRRIEEADQADLEYDRAEQATRSSKLN